MGFRGTLLSPPPTSTDRTGHCFDDEGECCCRQGPQASGQVGASFLSKGGGPTQPAQHCPGRRCCVSLFNEQPSPLLRGLGTALPGEAEGWPSRSPLRGFVSSGCLGGASTALGSVAVVVTPDGPVSHTARCRAVDEGSNVHVLVACEHHCVPRLEDGGRYRAFPQSLATLRKCGRRDIGAVPRPLGAWAGGASAPDSAPQQKAFPTRRVRRAPPGPPVPSEPHPGPAARSALSPTPSWTSTPSPAWPLSSTSRPPGPGPHTPVPGVRCRQAPGRNRTPVSRGRETRSRARPL